MSIEPRNKDFLNTIGKIMEDTTFKDFFNTYFSDWDDCVAAVMMMKAYQTLALQNPNANSQDIVKVLRTYMKDADFRHKLANGMFTFMKQHLDKPLFLPSST